MARLHLLGYDLNQAGLVEGDPIIALHDTHGWGKYGNEAAYLAAHPFLRIVWVPGLPRRRAQRLTESLERLAIDGDSEFEVEGYDESDHVVRLRRFRWWFRMPHDSTDTAERNAKRFALRRDHRVVIARSDLSTWLHDRCADDPLTAEHADAFDVPNRQRKNARRESRAGRGRRL